MNLLPAISNHREVSDATLPSMCEELPRQYSVPGGCGDGRHRLESGSADRGVSVTKTVAKTAVVAHRQGRPTASLAQRRSSERDALVTPIAALPYKAEGCKPIR